MNMPLGRQAEAAERRRYRRFRVSLAGRYLLTSGAEYRCRVRDISPHGVALTGPVAGRSGERVIAYVDRIGRLEGTIVRTFPTGFAMMIAATEYGRDRITARIKGIADREVLPEIMS